MPSFRDDHILIIAPGSQTTLAQLGLPESFTPPKFRIPSRMFPGIEDGTWAFTKIREARDGEKDELIAQAKGARAAAAAAAAAAAEEGEVEDDDDEGEEEDDGEEEEGEVKEGEGERREGDGGVEGEEKKEKEETPAEAEDDAMDEDLVVVEGERGEVYVEDEDDEEGAVWCLKQGRVTDWGCFFALLFVIPGVFFLWTWGRSMEANGPARLGRTYVHEMINPTFHTPILLVHPPEFTLQDKQMVTQFAFEKLKTPGFALIDAAVAALWAYGLSTATVVDVGFEKTDVTPIVEFVVQGRARKTVNDCGGETMTRHLCGLLPDMKPEDVETVKKSSVCEILPLGTPLPGSGDAPQATSIAMTAEEEQDALMNEEDGTVNVAAIVASGKTHEFLAKRELARKGQEERKLPNRERETNTFWVADKKRPGEEEEERPLVSPLIAKAPEIALATDGTNGAAAAVPELSPEDAEKRYKEASRRQQEKLAATLGIVLREDEVWRELTVGTERFRGAECGILHRISDALYASISSVEDVAKRADLWDNVIVVGNGGKVRGFKEALLQTVTGKYLIPPSSGTIFSSELPSNASTPGSSTPSHAGGSSIGGVMGGGGGQPNPLLVAATTRELQGYHQLVQQQQQQQHSSHGQTPLSMKVAKMPEYFPEWKEVGFEEAGFLGAQVAAKVVFVVDQGVSGGFVSRARYNEIGPEAVGDLVC